MREPRLLEPHHVGPVAARPEEGLKGHNTPAPRVAVAAEQDEACPTLLASCPDNQRRLADDECHADCALASARHRARLAP
eukprot:4445881-Pyramimonas_sp.AAC.1